MSTLSPDDPLHSWAAERLATAPAAWLTTVDAQGQPQSTPVWFLWDGSSFLIYSRLATRKLRNIAANPRVSLHLDGDGHGGDNVIVEGTAEVLAGFRSADEVPSYIEKYRGRIDAMGLTPTTLAAVYQAAIRVVPTRIRVW
jgi:PPOX class probable F420-dependent enzyme